MIKKLIDLVLNSPPVKKLVFFLENTKISKHKVSLMDVLNIFMSQFKKDDVQGKAQAMAFNFILAVFPGIIFLFTLIPYIPIKDLDDQILVLLEHVMPEGIYKSAKETIEDIVKKPRGGLLSLGFFMAMIASMNGTLAMMEAFNKCYKTVEKMNFFKLRLKALGITFLLLLVLVTAIIILIVGEVILGFYFEYLDFLFGHFQFYFFLVLRYTIVILTFFTGLSTIYYLAPAVHNKFGFFSVGAITATALIVIISLVFSIYLNHFATFNKLYGSIGTLIALMLWYYLMCIAILVGFEINASVEVAHAISERRKNESPKKNSFKN
ncbi:MAG: YihY/virulence factor BrkB family protein [Cytophagales bacterium]